MYSNELVRLFENNLSFLYHGNLIALDEITEIINKVIKHNAGGINPVKKMATNSRRVLIVEFIKWLTEKIVNYSKSLEITDFSKVGINFSVKYTKKYDKNLRNPVFIRKKIESILKKQYPQYKSPSNRTMKIIV